MNRPGCSVERLKGVDRMSQRNKQSLTMAFLQRLALIGAILAVAGLSVCAAPVNPGPGYEKLAEDDGFVLYTHVDTGIYRLVDKATGELRELVPESIDITAAGIGYREVAKRGDLVLYANPNTYGFAVEDTRTGHIWRSSPDEATLKDLYLGQWASKVRSICTVEYTDLNRRILFEAPVPGQNAIVEMKLGNPLVYSINLADLQISFQIRVELKQDGRLTVSIPRREIQEKAYQHLLVSITPFPFFGANSSSDNGFLLVPDGSGAVSYYRYRGLLETGFDEAVFGSAVSYSFARYLDPLVGYRPRLNMPVFGLALGNSAFLCMIDSGAHNAEINVSPADSNIALNRCSASFLYRRQTPLATYRDLGILIYQKVMTAMDAGLTYYLIASDEMSHVDMAQQYRRYLQEQIRLGDGLELDPRLQLRVFCGFSRSRMGLREFIPTTTFSEAKLMIDKLLEVGISKVDIILVGWHEGGYQALYPRHWPVSKALGGESGLRDLIEYAHQFGIRVFLEEDFTLAFSGNSGFSARRDPARDLGGIPYHSEGCYALSPRVSLAHASGVAGRLADLGIDGLVIRHLGQLMLDDTRGITDVSTALGETRFQEDVRAAYIQGVRRLIDTMRKELGSVRVEGANPYVFDVVDGVSYSPVRNVLGRYADINVPVLEIAVHGIIGLYGSPTNLSSEPTSHFLRNLEYGMMPCFELVWKNEEQFRKSDYSDRFSMGFEDWLPIMLRDYQAAVEELGHTFSMGIADHKRIAGDVAVTEFEDGTRVYVNYGGRPYVDTESGLQIEPLGYAVVAGGGAR